MHPFKTALSTLKIALFAYSTQRKESTRVGTSQRATEIEVKLMGQGISVSGYRMKALWIAALRLNAALHSAVIRRAEYIKLRGGEITLLSYERQLLHGFSQDNN